MRVRVPPESQRRGCEKSGDASSIFAFFVPVNWNFCSKTALSGFEPECSFLLSYPTSQHFEENSVIGRSSRFDSRIPLRARLRERRRGSPCLSAFSHLAFVLFPQRAKVAVKHPKNADHTMGALFCDPPLLIGRSNTPSFSHNSYLPWEGFDCVK